MNAKKLVRVDPVGTPYEGELIPCYEVATGYYSPENGVMFWPPKEGQSDFTYAYTTLSSYDELWRQQLEKTLQFTELYVTLNACVVRR